VVNRVLGSGGRFGVWRGEEFTCGEGPGGGLANRFFAGVCTGRGGGFDRGEDVGPGGRCR
jgi:hypothetical protein